MGPKSVISDQQPAFLCRPWMSVSGAAATPGGSSRSLKGILAGGLTGALEICITYPTEYVKTQLQLDGKTSTGGVKKYDGIADCVRKTVKQYGVGGLYRGLSVLLFFSVPKVSVRFGTFEAAKKFLMDEKGHLAPSHRALCGMFAGIGEAVAVVTPMETIKVKLINDRRSENPRYRGFIHGVSLIVKEQGIHGIYQGVVPTILKQGSNQAIRFFTMETLKHAYTGGDSNVAVPKYMIGLFGFFAGACSTYGNTPIDVVKTRMQGTEASRYKNTVDCVMQIWRKEGILAFYKGTVPRLTRVCLDVAITFMIYESFMDVFNKIWP